MNNSTDSKEFQAIDGYFDENLFPMALCKPDHNCNAPGKQPHRKNWSQHPLGDLRKWLARDMARFGNRCNLGLLCGEFNAITVIDIDTTEAVEYFSKHFKTDSLPPTVRTGRTEGVGIHVYFQYEPKLESSDITIDGHKFEIKNDGRQVVIPPSDHFSGSEYKWLREFSRDSLPAVPKSFLEAVYQYQHRKTNKTAVDFQGHRNDSSHPNEMYNNSDHYRIVLEQLGWSHVNTSGENEHWCRPGKTGAVSATFHVGMRVFYCFTDANTHFRQNRGYLPFMLLAEGKFGGNRNRAAEFIRELFGVEIEKPTQPNASYMEDENDEPEPETSRLETEVLRDDLYPFEIREYVPENSYFLDLYSRIFGYVTDAPLQFGFFGGLAALSMAARNAYLSTGPNDVRPNIWTCFVAPSSVYRKTTSLNIIRRLMTEFQGELELGELMSKEKFISKLGGEFEQDAIDPAGYFVWSEMSGPLKAFETKSYLSDFKTMLTDVFDSPPRMGKSTMKSGDVTLANPFVGIFAASTMDWLVECLTENNMKGGFIPRFLWIFAQRRDRQPFKPYPPRYSHEMRVDMAEYLNRIYTRFSGEDDQICFQPSPDALDALSEYTATLDRLALDASDNQSVLAAFYTRLATGTLKFALLYQIDRQCTQEWEVDSGNRIVELEAMIYAIKLTKYLQRNISHVVDRMTTDDLHTRRIKIVDIIRLNPGITEAALLRRSGLSDKDFNEATLTLQRADIVAKVKKTGRGRPTFNYYLIKRDQTEETVQADDHQVHQDEVHQEIDDSMAANPE